MDDRRTEMSEIHKLVGAADGVVDDLDFDEDNDNSFFEDSDVDDSNVEGFRERQPVNRKSHSNFQQNRSNQYFGQIQRKAASNTMDRNEPDYDVDEFAGNQSVSKTRTNGKFIGPLILILTVGLIVLFFVLRDAGNTEGKEVTQTQDKSTTVVSNSKKSVQNLENDDTIPLLAEISDKTVSDYVQVLKSSYIEDGQIFYALTGQMAFMKKKVVLNVSSKDYFEIQDYDIVKIDYNIGKYGEVEYITNTKLSEYCNSAIKPTGK